MISLYIHIPFCDVKCNYCNFFVIAEDEIAKNPSLDISKIKSEYILSLKKEIDNRYEKQEDRQIRTIYFWWGTPSSIWAEGLIEIIDHIYSKRDCSFIEEISIELNPNPFTEILALVKRISKKYETACGRIRFSFWIQSLDDEVLRLAGRKYVANNIKWFARELQKIKMSHNVYNFDMICFGSKLKKISQEWLEDWMFSSMADSWSIYLLELFPWSQRHNMYHQIDQITDPVLKKLVKLNEDDIMDEYDNYHNILEEASYKRYEVSNWTLPWMQSIHNTVYRTMQPYIWIWASASGFVNNTRYTNTTNIREYVKWNRKDDSKDNILQTKDISYETVMLWLRTDAWVKNLNTYHEVLREDYIDYINNLTVSELAIYEDDKLVLTNGGMNVANRIISELMK